MTWYNVGHRLLQIEAAFGASAVITEMLLQSHRGLIRLLPALPTQWSSGQIRGLKARGGFVIDMTWKDGRLTTATVRSLRGTPCRVVCCTPWDSVEVVGEQPMEHAVEVDSRVISFPTEPGRCYELRFR